MSNKTFLYNRPFTDIDILNSEALAWLGRTANARLHAGTKKIPYNEWCTERGSLIPFIAIPIHPPSILYTVRKDNTISWKGNFYTLPSGTYKGRGTQVKVSKDDASIVISDQDRQSPMHSDHFFRERQSGYAIPTIREKSQLALLK